MNIVIITELFAGMEEELELELKQRTAAIYDLVKYWSDRHTVICIREIPQGLKKWLKYSIEGLFGKKNLYHKIPDFYEADGIRIYTMKYLPYLRGGIWGRLRGKRFQAKVDAILQKSACQPDIIISHMPTFNVMYYIKRLGAGVPKVAVLHRSDLDKLYKKGTPVKRKVELLNMGFDKIFSRSQMIYLKAKESGLTHLTGDIISSGVPVNVQKERNWLNLKERRINILYAGALIEQKGVQLILRGISNLTEQYSLKLTIVGSGSYETCLQDLTKSLHLEDQVDFAGQKSRAEVQDYMRDADIFIMPSRHETLGLVYLEAMSSGCITIGSRGEGIDGVIVDGENGYLVKPNNGVEISECLDHIINMTEDKLQKISDAAIRTTLQYSDVNVSEQYLRLIEKAAGKADASERVEDADEINGCHTTL